MNTTAYPVNADSIPWLPLHDGLSLRPLYFSPDGYCAQLRIEPGVTIPRHRHTGEVHAYNLAGCRELIETGEIARPGTYIYEPPGNEDSWRCVGYVPCIVQFSITGRVEYLGPRDEVLSTTDSRTACEAYLRWCAQQGRSPDPAIIRGLDVPADLRRAAAG